MCRLDSTQLVQMQENFIETINFHLYFTSYAMLST